MNEIKNLSKAELLSYVEDMNEKNHIMTELFEKASAMIMVFSSDGKILRVNNAWKKKLGYSTAEVNHLKFKSILHPDSSWKFQKKLKELNEENVEEITLETTFQDKFAGKLHVSGSINRHFTDKKGFEYSAIFYDISDKVKAEKAQMLFYSISGLMLNSSNLEELYSNIHKELDNVIEAGNFSIALYEEDRDLIRFSIFLDEHHPHPIYDSVRKAGRGLTEFTIRENRPVLLYKENILGLLSKGEIDIMGNIPEAWLAVPFQLDPRTRGLIAVQCYHNRHAYSQKDLELLNFISGQVALAIKSKLYEEEIIHQAARLKAIVRSSTHLIWTINKNYELTIFNNQHEDAIREYFSVKIKDKTSEGTPFARDNRMREDNKFWLEKYKLAFTGRSMHFEVLLKDKTSRDIWKEIFINPIYDRHGNVSEISGIATDITAKKQSELDLLESEEMFRNIFNSFQDIYFRCNIQGNLTMISPSLYELLGYEPEKVLGKNITDYYLYNTRIKDLIRQLVKNKSVRNFEASVIKENGQLLQCICNIRIIYGKNGKPSEIEGVARDITELKRTNLELLHAKELAERSLKVKERFLANMSHEIRTPMNGVIGMVDLLNSTELDKEQKHYVEIISKSSRTLLNILNDILDISKIEAGKMRLRKTPLRLAGIIDKLHSLFSQQANEQNISFGYQIAPELPPFILADETRLLQILSNLTSNALKFTEKGGKVEIKLSREGPEKHAQVHLIKVEVIDSGIGIEESQLEKLFSSFSQVDNSPTKAYGGTGLGLVISKELSRMMNGQVGVESKAGEGSTFWFTFEAEESEASEFVEQDVEENYILKSQFFENEVPYILLVDDNDINRQVACTILSKAGCKVDVAINGFDAVEKAKKNPYQLIFMDIQMPEMDGITATKEIKKLKLEFPPVIVAMTAYSMQDEKKSILESGLDDYLAKPIKAKNLIQKVQEYLAPEKLDSIRDVINNKQAIEIGVIIENEAVEQLMKWGGTELLQSAFFDFNEEAGEQLAICLKSYNENDYLTLINNLHSLKGSAGTLGIKKVAQTAMELEKQIKEKDYTFVEEKLFRLQDEFNEYKEFFKEQYN